MVSFSCEVCNDTVIKKKLDQHRNRCHGAYFTCIDCSTTFNGDEYRYHTQCISEAEKYEKSLYKGKPTKQQKPEPKAAKVAEPKEPKKSEPKKAESKKSEKKSEKTEKKSDKSKFADLSKYSSGPLYKIVKSIAKDTKTDKKDVLKKLQVKVVDGKLELTL